MYSTIVREVFGDSCVVGLGSIGIRRGRRTDGFRTDVFRKKWN